MIHPFSAHLTTSSALFPQNGSGEGPVLNYQQMQSFSNLAQRAMKTKMSSSSTAEGGKKKNHLFMAANSKVNANNLICFHGIWIRHTDLYF